jgi:hypothetical protein
MAEVGMQSPWVVYVKAVKALFAHDQDVIVGDWEHTPNTNVYKLSLFVHGNDKAASIAEVLPERKEFGNVTLEIEVVPDNDGKLTMLDHIRRAFAGNPALVDVMEYPVVPGGPSMAFALFAPEVVQIECDNAASPYGIVTTTYEGVAKDVLNVEGVMIASELEE